MDVSKNRGIVGHSCKRAVANREFNLTESMQVLLDLQSYRILKMMPFEGYLL